MEQWRKQGRAPEGTTAGVDSPAGTKAGRKHTHLGVSLAPAPVILLTLGMWSASWQYITSVVVKSLALETEGGLGANL